MEDINGDDRVMATAHHIIRTLGSDNASDMLRILSTFDDRFSRFSLSLPNNGSDEEGIPAVPLPSAVCSAETGDAALEKALDLIHTWDFGSSESARQTFIWTDDPDEAGPYLSAIDSIQVFLENPPSGVDPSALDRVQNALQLAMLRLEEELRNLMEKYGESIDPDLLQEMAYNNGDEKRDSSELEQEEKSFQSLTIDLFPEEIVTDIYEIATRMVSFGYQTECTQVFMCNRKTVLEENLQRLGFERLTIEDVQRMPWDFLESEIFKWTRIMKLTIGVLFRSEKQLCESVFKKDTSFVDATFYELAKGPMTQLLNFGEAVAIGRRAPEKLFKILDMYESLRDLSPSIEGLFVGETSASLRAEANTILVRLGDAARGTFAEFENAVQHETSRNPVPGGAVHPLTRYVMNYIRFFTDYADTLNHLLKDRTVDQSGSFNSRSEAASRGPLSMVTLSLLELLEKNLDVKSKLYKDPALTLLFLMNNLHYIVQKSKDVEVRKLIGDEWIKRHSGKLHQYHTDYRRTAWTKVLSFLRDDGISVSGGSVSGTTRNLLKERFKNFNMAFEENVKAQSSWIVSDSQLCAELQISITEMILPAYRNFLGRFQNHLDVVKNRERYVKYTPEEVEEHINALFEGSSGSMNRRRAQE
ncbi:hypothetical protein GOP47_0016051 [Adiantum capillus-veneris]|uniref:Exocyst subunit Exo70 family protein n=1 Tax=Adiantum capillus-veneris TaxID=13818 RepID=A0A9D4UKU3_ADICA|nr:hypothetical protein GOP47_0016051 [Adiantum capillus-veneris]